MGKGSKKHVLAVLREIVGLTQAQLAALVERSYATIHSIELGKLALSEKLAEEISYETGISREWLLENDLGKPPIGFQGEKYSKAFFEAWRSLTRDADPFFGGLVATDLPASAAKKITAMALQAYRDGTINLFSYKLNKALDALEDQFGAAKEVGDIRVEDFLAQAATLLGVELERETVREQLDQLNRQDEQFAELVSVTGQFFLALREESERKQSDVLAGTGESQSQESGRRDGPTSQRAQQPSRKKAKGGSKTTSRPRKAGPAHSNS